MSPGPIFDFIDVPLEGIDALGNQVELNDVAKAIVMANLVHTGEEKDEQLNYASMQASMAANSVNNDELGTKVNGA